MKFCLSIVLQFGIQRKADTNSGFSQAFKSLYWGVGVFLFASEVKIHYISSRIFYRIHYFSVWVARTFVLISFEVKHCIVALIRLWLSLFINTLHKHFYMYYASWLLKVLLKYLICQSLLNSLHLELLSCFRAICWINVVVVHFHVNCVWVGKNNLRALSYYF